MTYDNKFFGTWYVSCSVEEKWKDTHAVVMSRAKYTYPKTGKTILAYVGLIVLPHQQVPWAMIWDENGNTIDRAASTFDIQSRVVERA